MEQKQERGKGEKDVKPWGTRHATAEDVAFSGTPANLMDMNSPLVPWSPTTTIAVYHLGSCDLGGQTPLPPLLGKPCMRRSGPCQLDPDLSADQLFFPRRRRKNERKKE